MVKLLRALICALLTVVALVVAAPRAAAAPPTAPWTGASVGNVIDLDLDLATLDLAGAEIANSESTASSTATPRSSSTSRNLAAPVAGLGILVQENSQTAPPDNAAPETGALVPASALGISTGTITFSNLARWLGDASCVTDGPTADTTTSTTGVTVSPVGAVDLFSTGDSSVRSTVALVPAASEFNRAVQSEAIGTTSGSSLFGGLVTVAVTGNPTLTAVAPGTPGDADVTYDDPEVEVTFAGDTTPIPVGGSLDIDLGVTGAVTISVNPPTETIDPDGLSASAAVNVITYAVRIGPAVAPLGTATINQLPLSVSAAVPDGGIDCPPPAPVIDEPDDGDLVDDTTPTFTGTGVPGAIIDLTVDNVVIADDIVVDEDGNWTFTATTPLAQGPHTVSASQTLRGTPSPESAVNDFLIDSVAPDAPVITAPTEGSTITDNTPTVTGTGEPGATVSVEIDGEPVGEAVVAGNGTWTLPLTDPLDDGEHTVTATQTDEAGNESEADEVTFAVDTEALPPVITDPADGSSTDDTTPTVRGTAEPGASVAVEVDGTPVGTVIADDDGNFELPLTDPLDEGDHTVSAVQTDVVGNVSEAAENDFTVAVPPDAPVITAPTEGSTITDNTPTVTGTGEPGATVTVEIDGEPVGEATVDGDGNWTLPLTDALDDGEHTVTATQTDEAGNESEADEVTFAVDTEALPPVITAPADGSSTNDTTPTVVGTAEPGASVVVSIDGTPVGTVIADDDGNFELPLTDPLDEGDHTVSAVQTDVLGNVSEAGENDFTVDLTAPAPPVITSPDDGDTVDDRTPTVEGTGEPGTTIVVIVDGEPVGAADVDEDGNWSLTLPGPLSDGPHTIEAVAIDEAGNESGSDSVDITVEISEDAGGGDDGGAGTPGDGPELADTGGPSLGYAIAGGVLLLLGGTVLSLTRRRA